MFYNFSIDDNLRNFLVFCINSGASKISNIISRDEFLNPIGNYFKVEDFGHVSFIPKSKLPIVQSDPTSDVKYRTKIRIGRFVSKIIKKEFISIYGVNSDDIEIFVNIFKSYFDSDVSNLSIVEGDEILKWYLEQNYHFVGGGRTGSLWHSCMRYTERNRFMRLYSENKGYVKMLIKTDPSTGGLVARAILWENCSDIGGGKYKVMDRIYTLYDHDIVTFKTWANKNGYMVKADQSSRSEQLFEDNGDILRKNIFIELPNHRLDYYPYLDTFKFYDSDRGIFSNYPRGLGNYVLVQFNGSIEREEEITCEYADDED